MAIESRYPLKVMEELAPFPPIQNTANPYLTEAAMHLDQANQLEGYGYLVDGVGAFIYLGTLVGTAADYKAFGGGSNLEKVLWNDYISFRNINGSNIINGVNCIVLGFQNTSKSHYNNIVSYRSNVDGLANGIIGGVDNSIYGNYNGILSGYTNVLEGNYNVILGGRYNKLLGDSEGRVLGGIENTLNHYYSCAFGFKNKEIVNISNSYIGANFLIGMFNTVEGNSNALLGMNLAQTGNSCLVGGRYNIDLNGSLTEDINDLDARFIIGNGAYDSVNNSSSRSNAFVVLHSGEVSAPSLSLALIEASNDFVLITKGYLKENYIKKPAGVYADNAAALAGGLVIDETYRTADGIIKIVF